MNKFTVEPRHVGAFISTQQQEAYSRAMYAVNRLRGLAAEAMDHDQTPPDNNSQARGDVMLTCEGDYEAIRKVHVKFDPDQKDLRYAQVSEYPKTETLTTDGDTEHYTRRITYNERDRNVDYVPSEVIIDKTTGVITIIERFEGEK
ncbi:MAG: hypothetical protein AB1758_31515 [Candidatus Eremiobacterota bacterium]